MIFQRVRVAVFAMMILHYFIELYSAILNRAIFNKTRFARAILQFISGQSIIRKTAGFSVH